MRTPKKKYMISFNKTKFLVRYPWSSEFYRKPIFIIMNRVCFVLFLKILSCKKRCIILPGLIFLIYVCYFIFITIHRTEKDDKTNLIFAQRNCPNNLPVVRFHGIHPNETILDNVKEIFKKIGYRFYKGDYMLWDVLWSYTYPFYSLSEEMLHLRKDQKINHFPGSGYITQKSNLAALSDIVLLPKSFILPEEKKTFLEYAKKNTNKSWILKSSNHRGMKLITNLKDIEVNESFVQEFVQKPLLISGKKFDIGLYVVLTSIDPLRVYVFAEDILLRFCKIDYYPFNIEEPESFVVGDDYLPIWEVPDLKMYFSKLNYTAKESLNTYILSKGKSSKKLWTQMYNIIQNVYLKTEDYLKQSTLSLGSLRNFFELVRFDFILDEDLNPFLLEVNMSPNLSSAHFPENKLMYSQVIFSTLSIAGLVRKFHDSFHYRGEAEVSEKDIQVFAEQCFSEHCLSSCKNFKCQICNQCMNAELKSIAKSSYLEFINRAKFRRLLPKPIAFDEDHLPITPTSEMNAFMDLWFKGKCSQDPSWCY